MLQGSKLERNIAIQYGKQHSDYEGYYPTEIQIKPSLCLTPFLAFFFKLLAVSSKSVAAALRLFQALLP